MFEFSSNKFFKEVAAACFWFNIGYFIVGPLLKLAID